jgi:hypothetical protein
VPPHQDHQVERPHRLDRATDEFENRLRYHIVIAWLRGEAAREAPPHRPYNAVLVMATLLAL